jgi:NAD(P)H-hydrate epimerase
MHYLNREQSRAADRFAIEHLGIPGIVLMENAGRGCAEFLLEIGAARGVVICCGGGNNGGDGFVIARHLLGAGVPVKVILFSPPKNHLGDAAVNLRIIERLPLEIVQFEAEWSDERLSHHLNRIGRTVASWVVDALLGTGATGSLREPLNRVVRMINEASVKRMSVDIPTGLDCDTGIASPPAVKADVTCTFIAAKSGFQNKEAWQYLGHQQVVSIGIQNVGHGFDG